MSYLCNSRFYHSRSLQALIQMLLKFKVYFLKLGLTFVASENKNKSKYIPIFNHKSISCWLCITVLFKWGHTNIHCTVYSNRARKKWRWSRVKACFSSTAELAIIIFFSSLSVCALLPVGQRFIITLMKLKVGKSPKIFHINEWNYCSTKKMKDSYFVHCLTDFCEVTSKTTKSECFSSK